MATMRRHVMLVVLGSLLGTSGWILITSEELRNEGTPLDLPIAHADDEPVEFYGFAPGTSIVWCIDTSGSMGWTGEIGALKFEVIQTLGQLSPPSQFSIVEFDGAVTQFSATMLDATPTAISDGIDFVNGLNAGGGTCLAAGLTAALTVAETAMGDVSILVAGDGPDTCGTVPLTPQQLVSTIAPWNPSAIPIHCFHISSSDDAGVPSYQALSAANGGEFFDNPTPTVITPSQWFLRGDSNSDGVVEISDVISTLESLFLGAPMNCLDANDVNDDGELNVADPVYLLIALFGSGTPPPPPYLVCGTDPTCDLLDCIGPVPGCPTVSFMPSQFASGLTPTQEVLEGDFNGDSVPDLVVLHDDITLLRGIGGGDYVATPTTPLASPYNRMVTGDLNNDGVLDLVLGRVGVSSDTHLTLLGNGDGTFVPTQALDGASIQRLDLGDVNNDGNLDLVESGYSQANSVRVRLGNGDGTLGPATTYDAGNSPTVVFAVDLNNDGNLDIASAAGNSDDVIVRLGDGTGLFGGPLVTDIPGQINDSVEFGDMNGDGVLDLVSAAGSPTAVHIFFGNGDGTFTLQSSTPTPAAANLALGDVNLDGALDVVFSGGPDAHVYFGNGDSGLAAFLTVTVGSVFLSDLKLIDTDQDGDLDIVSTSNGGETEVAENLLIP